MKENLAFLSITLGLILITQVKAAVNYTSFSPNGPVFTEVTCYYDIPSEGWSTPYQQQFQNILKTPNSLIVFGSSALESRIWQKRFKFNTVFIPKEIQQLKLGWHNDMIKDLIKNGKNMQDNNTTNYPIWLMYSKFNLLSQAIIYDKFQSDYFIWTDPYNYLGTKKPTYLFGSRHFRFIQPQWLMMSLQDEVSRSLSFLEGESKYCGRNLEFYEHVNANYMGGYVQLVQDIKHASENFLKIVLNDGLIPNFDSYASIFTERFPSIFPINLKPVFQQKIQRIHFYRIHKRKPIHSRFIKVSFDSQTMIIEQNIEMHRSLFTPLTKFTKEELDNKITQSIEQFEEWAKNQSKYDLSFQKQTFYKEFAFLTLLISIYVFIYQKFRKISQGFIKN